MMGNSFYILAYRIEIEPLDKLYVYSVVEDELIQSRRMLYGERIPHTIRLERGYTSFEIYATARSKDLEKELGIQPREIDWSHVSDPIINELAVSCMRIELFNKGWRRGLNKIYNPRLIESLRGLTDIPIHIYRALRISADSLPHGVRTLFIDPCYKLEYIKTLDELEDISQYIRWVKLKHSHLSFYIVDETYKEFLKQIDVNRYEKEVKETINEYLGEVIDIKFDNETVCVKPRSTRFSEFVKKKLRTPLTETSEPVLVLPKSSLSPVASLENIKLLGDEVSKKIVLRISPNERYELVQETIGNVIGTDENITEWIIKQGGLRVKVYLDDIVKPPGNEVYIADVNKYISCSGKEEKDPLCIYKWMPFFKNREEGDATYIVKLNLNDNTVREYYDKVAKVIISRFEEKLRYGFKNVREIPISSNQIDDIISEVLNEIKSKGSGKKIFVILLFHESIDPSGRAVYLFEYELAKNKIYPIVIDLTDIVNKMKRGEDADALIRWKIKSVLKNIGIKMNAVNLKLQPPSSLRKHLIAGIDSTLYHTLKGAVYLVVVVYIVQPNGTHSVNGLITHDLSGVGFSEVDSLVYGIRKTLDETKDKLIVLVNRSSLTQILNRLSNDELDMIISGEFVLTGVSKTHSYSRILEKYGNKFVNPNRTGILVELSSYQYGYDRSLINISRYLGLTTLYRGKEFFEEGTIKPVVVNLATNLSDHSEIAKFITSLSHFAVMSHLWTPSLPWPLHRADKISKKIHRILELVEPTRKTIPLDDVNNAIRYL